MIEEGKYCIDILNQIQAVKGALARIEDNILKKHLQGCVAEAIKGSCEKEKEAKARYDELVEAGYYHNLRVQHLKHSPADSGSIRS